MNPILLTLILLLTGVAGGLISSTAGMASLVTYPVLLALGVPPVSANVTNTAAMIFTGVGSGLASTQELSAHRKMMWQVGVWAVIGGIVGALILAVAPASSFEKVVPFLIAIADVLMLSSLRQKPAPEQVGHTVRGWRLVGRNFLIFLVGVYIGYFGASAGVMMLSILAVTLPVSFAVSNALKNFATLLTNIVSLVIYAFTTKVYWLMVIPLGLGMFAGGLLGPVVVRHVSNHLIRLLIGIGAFALAGYFFYTAYLQ
ncbi:MAG: sulfite exporter TauE/SafE family protein [Lactobacillus sp.]|jgi:uncharacterized membrane protein YfcA|nr:sulfite exporter TauE/SafE family protein [Lactobacillus sp.]MCI1940581.1 sulfite exporter TauE/SafE family protein [Lactobacillus sp.]MCI1971014.1 sulfite exporter TauE/SafE family protein [Lactobacillus sp.]MCI2016260.1 sulfite exporter TauE/SafE family protein [Lactobacillus sp.]MCI2037094.1 sulfite exporter TauE/SafE family protein [Lactobacillus sp.]